jgi:ribonuclease P/MRP protein subunit RPP1
VGYTAIALNQVIRSKFDPNTHVDLITPLRKQLRPRGPGLIILSRLTIILDTESEQHGIGLTAANVSSLSAYDILAVMPTTQNTFSAACSTHSLPSQMTTHIIALPLMMGTQLPIKMKHTLVRTAIRNGSVFEISYTGALGGVDEMGEGGAVAKRNWWTAAREVVRATKGKGLIVSGGAGSELELRGPKDVNNLCVFFCFYFLMILSSDICSKE